MDNIRIILCGFLFSSAIITFFVFVYTVRKKDNFMIYFSALNLCISIYSFGYAMEIYSDTLNQMIFWNMIQYIGLPFIPSLWLMFTLEYNNKKVDFLMGFVIFFIPVFTSVFRYTNSLHHLLYTGLYLTSNGLFPVLFLSKGPWYWANVIFYTGVLIITNYTYIQLYKKSYGIIRNQSLLMLIASYFPWISAVLDLLNISPLDIDYGPYAIACSMIVFTIAFFKYEFLNIKPLARDLIFDSTNEGIIVFDINYNMVDFNPSAAEIFHILKQDSVGKSIKEIFKGNEKLINSIFAFKEIQLESKNGSKKNSYRVNTTKVYKSENEVGYIVAFTEITKYVDMMERLNNIASKDMLTGTFNRRYFVELSMQELEKLRLYKSPASFVILDLDFFKQINDNYGHQAGDAVLKKVAAICRDSVRSTDILGRYGGEEFVIFLPDTSLEQCRIIAERILNNISDTEINYEGVSINVTASMGIAGVNSVEDENLDYFLKYADEELYRAKMDGRNCIRCSIIYEN